MKRTDIRKNPDGSWKTLAGLSKIGKRGKKNKREDAVTKAALIAERGNVCEMAGQGECAGPIEVHHTRTKAAHPELRHSHDNLKILCLRHHSQLHIGEWKS